MEEQKKEGRKILRRDRLDLWIEIGDELLKALEAERSRDTERRPERASE